MKILIEKTMKSVFYFLFFITIIVTIQRV